MDHYSYALFGIVVLGTLSCLSAWYDTKHQKTLTNRTVILVWMAYIAHGALTFWSSRYSIWSMGMNSKWISILGVTFCVIGTYMYVAALVEFRSFQRMSGMQVNKLVDTGIYKYSRNPQNVGWFLFLLGVSLLGTSVFSLILSVVFFVMFCSFLPIEERHLALLYGEDWQRYSQKSPRFIGFPKE